MAPPPPWKVVSKFVSSMTGRRSSRASSSGGSRRGSQAQAPAIDADAINARAQNGLDSPLGTPGGVSRRANSFLLLPDLVIQKIFTYLNRAGLLAVQRVCQQWRELSDDPAAQLWHHCWISRQYPCPDHAAAMIARRFVQQVDDVGMCLCVATTDKALMELAKCSELKKVNLSGCEKITDKGLKAMVLGCKALEDVKLERCYQLTDNALQYLSYLPRVRKMKLRNCRDITDEGLSHLSKMETLEEIDFSWCKNITAKGMQHLIVLQRVRILDLSNLDHLDDDALTHVAKFPKLSSLDISYCGGITDEGILAVAKAGKYLRDIAMNGCDGLHDDALKYLSKCSNLREFCANNCTFVSDTGIRYLARLPRLNYVEITGCEMVTAEGLSYLQHVQNVDHD